jgi:hypothetical protein
VAAKDNAKGETDNGETAKDDKAGKTKSAGASEHSNKDGKLRGLDRADQAAGEHGEQGRDNARAKQER